uniref:Uncharacterized protein n=1 Tax=Palpitomonas bilix TaxID=652834 RepID=A0A7S3GCJ9_9EUKA|mmetsp:Transcript_43533/g.113342  ORF Transcript_43533/g.113342 Transcript_43533/m.113342 type:complete len:126 (+) Transcript_43533:17-394(+)
MHQRSFLLFFIPTFNPNDHTATIRPEDEIRTLLDKKKALLAGGHTEEEAIEILTRAVDELRYKVVEEWMSKPGGEELVEQMFRSSLAAEDAMVSSANQSRTDRLAALEERKLRAKREAEEDEFSF